MSSLEIVLLVVVIVVVVALVVTLVILIPRLNKGKGASPSTSESKASDDRLIQMMSSTLTSLNNKMDDYNQKTEKAIGEVNASFEKKVGEINKSIDDMMHDTSTSFDKKITEVNESIVQKMGEVNVSLENIKTTQKNLDEMSKDMTDLKTVLVGNQSRGQYGEMQLSSILQQYFRMESDNTYREQYTIKSVKDGSDVKPDAIVYLPNDLFICVDSKFPFRDFSNLFSDDELTKTSAKKDFKAAVIKHIDAISEKYIIEGMTFPYAIMFIPSDSIDVFIHDELSEIVDYAYTKNVILASPRVLGPLLVEIRMLKQEEERNKLAKQLTIAIDELSKQFDHLFQDTPKKKGEWTTFSNRVKGLEDDVEKIDKRAKKINKSFQNIKSNDIIKNALTDSSGKPGEIGFIDHDEINDELLDEDPDEDIDEEEE